MRDDGASAIPEVPMDPMVSALIVRLEEVFLDRVLYRRLLSCHGPSAQNLLDSFQWVLDVSELDPMFRRKLIVATQRLSAGSSLYPVCYELKDVVRGDQFPVTAGGLADIYKGTLYGQDVCIKAIRVYERDQVEHILKRFSKEAILWGQLSHPNTLPVYGLYRLQTRICIVSPWMEAGDITKYLKSRPEAARLPLASLAIDVAQGLSYLHSNAIIHGDLKGPNILIDDEGRARPSGFWDILSVRRRHNCMDVSSVSCLARRLSPILVGHVRRNPDLLLFASPAASLAAVFF
ncbi:kinase-like domain-containing protein [Lyophyllum atratum]|nr:kinase-like domain-containing protein [Lyophyllum atratum]